MADYKSILTGTLKNLAGKVKDVAETSGIKDVYSQGLERTKSYGSIAKLSLEINGQTEELKRVYQEIGKLYYEESKDAPEGIYASLFANVEALKEAIRTKQEDINALRAELASSAESDIDVEIGDFEKIVDESEKDVAGE